MEPIVIYIDSERYPFQEIDLKVKSTRYTIGKRSRKVSKMRHCVLS